MKKIEVFSPARADLAGGTLDIYPIYLFFNKSFTLNCTLSKGVRITIERIKGKTILKNRNTGVSGYYPAYHNDLKIITILLESLNIENGLKIEFFSDFPRGSSLGVSSSLLVAVLYGLKVLFQFKYSRRKMVEILKNVETKVIGYPAGLQDYLAPLYGGLNAFYFSEHGIKTRRMRFWKDFKNSFLFVFTGETHFSGIPNWELFKGFFDREKTVLKGFEDIYNNSKKVLQSIENKDLISLGLCLKEDFETRKKTMSSLIPDIDLFEILDKTRGVLGYRLCGAASGGTAVVCVTPSERENVKGILSKSGYTVFDCEFAKNRVIEYHV